MKIGDVKFEDGKRYELIAVFLGHKRFKNSYVAQVTDGDVSYVMAVNPDWWKKVN